MRWRALFADLEAQAEALSRAELDAEVRDRTRRESGLVRLVDRLAAAEGAALVLLLEGAGTVAGVLLEAGPDWLLLEEAGREVLVPLSAVLAVSGAGGRARTPGSEGEVARRLDLRWALRGLARDRAEVAVLLRDGSTLVGALDRVGADHVELVERAPDRTARGSRAARLLPVAAVVLLRRSA